MIIPGFRQDYHIMISNRGVDPDLEVAMLISGEVIHQNKGWMFGPTAEARKAWFALCRDIQRLLLTPEETALILGICLTYSGSVKHLLFVRTLYKECLFVCWYRDLVFQTFLCYLLRSYCLEIWYMNLSWHNTGQVRLSLHLTFFYMNYCPLLKFSFLYFSLPSYIILKWNLVYKFVLT